MERVVTSYDAPLAADTLAQGTLPDWLTVVGLVRRQMRSLLGPGRELDDLTQTALERICRSREDFEGRSEFTTYSYRVCLSVALDHWRWHKRWLRRLERFVIQEPELEEGPTDAGQAILRRERVVRLRIAMDRLSPLKRSIVTLCELEELPASRVAEITGCPEPTVRSRLRQGRLELERILRNDPLFCEEP